MDSTPTQECHHGSTVSKCNGKEFKHDSTHKLTRMMKFHGVADGSEVGAAKMLVRSTGPKTMSQSLRHLLHTTWHYTSSLLSILRKEAPVSKQAITCENPARNNGITHSLFLWLVELNVTGECGPNRWVHPRPQTPPSPEGALDGHQPWRPAAPGFAMPV